MTSPAPTGLLGGWCLSPTGVSGRASSSTGRRALLCVVAAFLGLQSPVLAGRIVAVGDIHGNFEGFVDILQRAELIDEERRWLGGDATLLQTGDFLDRGAEVRAVMDLLMELQEQAPKQGGKVIVLLGNHEAMNLLGFRRDINPKIFEGFAESGSQERREKLWGEYVRWSRQRAKRKKEPRPWLSPAEKGKWEAAHPLGAIEYQEALGSEGRYGKWLRSLDTAIELDRVVFVHGGVPPSLAGWTLDRINDRTRGEIEQFDVCRELLLRKGVIYLLSDPYDMVREGSVEIQKLSRQLERARDELVESIEGTVEDFAPCVDYQDWFLIKEESPLWFRGFARWTDQEAQEALPALLSSYQAEHFVVAHTPRANGRIDVRFGGRVFVIDTGMLSSFYAGGRASALEIQDGQFTAIYPDGREPLAVDLEQLAVAAVAPPRYWAPDGQRLPFLDDEDVLEFLLTAQITASERRDQGVNHILRLTLEKDGVRAYAAFRSVDVEKERHRTSDGRLFFKFRDSYRYEPAAYLLDRMLGIDRVPPAVLRKYDRRRGSLQLWVHHVIDEEGRREQQLEPPHPVQWLEERSTRHLFDSLIYNVDRNQGNMLIDQDTWKVWLIDHGRAFLEQKDLLNAKDVRRCPRRVWSRLQTLSEKEVKAQLESVLTAYEIKALWSRWQKLVSHVSKLVEEHGEDSILYGAPWTEPEN